MSAVDSSPFGDGLRHWRRIRGVSQLELAATAETTTRHLSFLETGRSRPSREMVDRLGDALTIPLRERNRLLAMAGPPPGYVEGDLESQDLAPFQAVIDRLLAADLLRFPDDPILQALHDRLVDALGPFTQRSEPSTSRVICPRFRLGDTTIRTITIAARFESVADITLDEIRVELTYPEDDTSERCFRDQLAGP